MTVRTRASKGSALTHAEMDENLTTLRDFTQEGSDVTRTFLIKNRDHWTLDDFIDPTADENTAEVSVEIQTAFDAINDEDMQLLPGRRRRFMLEDTISLVSSATSGHSGKTRILDFGGATFDFSGGAWSDDYLAGEQTNLFTFGTAVNTVTPSDPQAIIEQGIAGIRNLRIEGNEPTISSFTTPNPGVLVPTKGIVGLRCQLLHDAELSNITVVNCTVPFEYKDSWGLKCTRLRGRNGWIAHSVKGGCTFTTFDMCAAVQCAYSWVFAASTQSAAPFYGAYAAITEQMLLNCHFENVWYGPILFPHDTDIRGVKIIGAYTEDVGRDFIVSGLQFSQADLDDPASMLSSASGNKVDRLTVELGDKLSFGAGGGTYYAFRGPTGSIKNVHSKITLPVLRSDVSSAFGSTVLILLGADTGNAGEIVTFDKDGTEGPGIDMQNGILMTRSFTVAGVPSDKTAGGIIYVSNETGGATLAFADGTDWRRVQDRAVVS